MRLTFVEVVGGMDMNRRRFLGAAALGVVATACSPKPKLADSTTPTTTTTTASQAPVPPDWNALRSRLPGGLVLPGDSAYAVASQSYNPRFDNHRPAAIARCTSVDDVQRCVEVARNAGLQALGGDRLDVGDHLQGLEHVVVELWEVGGVVIVF
ncbi:twin-arginine translocation signal domain-containing protein, partial [Actinophytocola sp.]|uniref:twin-arginine translocation signal domain-containing protein n=1 Tax=Actinophytocola sp. TaxID=1872138 RepID=UPI003899A79D